MSGQLLQVAFHGDTIDCVRNNDEDAFVVIRKVCENLGVNYATQFRKLQNASWATIVMMTTVGNDGKSREMACLRIDSLPMWLAGINPKKVKDAFLKRKLELYQAEAAQVLWRHFSHQGIGSEAILAKLDRIGDLLEARQDEAFTQLRQEMDRRFEAHERAIETRLQEQLPLAFRNPPAATAAIDVSQQAQVRSLLKSIADRQGITFQKAQGMLRCHFPGLGSYRFLRNEQWPEAVAFLQVEAAKGAKTSQQLLFDEALALN